jgi:hypothetical protein
MGHAVIRRMTRLPFSIGLRQFAGFRVTVSSEHDGPGTPFQAGGLPVPSERSTFLQDQRKDDRIADHWLWWVAIAIGVATSVWFANPLGLAVSIPAYLVLGVTYGLLARIFRWRRMRWMAFIGNLLRWLEWLT